MGKVDPYLQKVQKISLRKKKPRFHITAELMRKWHHVKLRRVFIQMVASRDIVLQIQKFYSASSVYIPYLVFLMYKDYSVIG